MLDFWKTNLEKGFVLFIGLEFGLVGGGVTLGTGDEDWVEGVQCRGRRLFVGTRFFDEVTNLVRGF